MDKQLTNVQLVASTRTCARHLTTVWHDILVSELESHGLGE